MTSDALGDRFWGLIEEDIVMSGDLEGDSNLFVFFISVLFAS